MNKFLIQQFLKNFLLIFFAFCAFYVFVDVIINYKKLSFNTNLFLIYLLVTFILAAYFLLPAAIMLALLVSKAAMLARNEFLALRSLGLSPLRIAAPQLFCALFICALFCLAALSKAPYAADFRDNILHSKSLVHKQQNLLLATPEAMIYAARAGESRLENPMVIYVANARISRLISAKSARYLGQGRWELLQGQISTITSTAAPASAAADAGASEAASDAAAAAEGAPEAASSPETAAAASIASATASEEEFGKLIAQILPAELQNDAQMLASKDFLTQRSMQQSLQDFERLELNLRLQKEAFMHKNADTLSLLDAIKLLGTLEENRPMRAAIYQYSVFLLFAPFLGVALWRLLPSQTRFSELSVHLIAAIFVGLIIFGCLNLLQRFSQNGAISPEMGILAPSILIIVISIYHIYKQNFD